CVLIVVGGFFVGTRAGRRHAKNRHGAAETTQTVGAALWAAGTVPLIVTGLAWFATRNSFWRQPGVEIAGVVFGAAALAMPVCAYLFARERLVAATRRYESGARVATLALGAFLFFAVPASLLVSWWVHP